MTEPVMALTLLFLKEGPNPQPTPPPANASKNVGLYLHFPPNQPAGKEDIYLYQLVDNQKTKLQESPLERGKKGRSWKFFELLGKKFEVTETDYTEADQSLKISGKFPNPHTITLQWDFNRKPRECNVPADMAMSVSMVEPTPLNDAQSQSWEGSDQVGLQFRMDSTTPMVVKDTQLISISRVPKKDDQFVLEKTEEITLKFIINKDIVPSNPLVIEGLLKYIRKGKPDEDYDGTLKLSW